MSRMHLINKIQFVDWLASPLGPRPTSFMKKFRPRMSVRLALALRHTLSGRPARPRRFEYLYIPTTPFVKVVALRHHAKTFGPRVFVETGTCRGDTTEAVADLFQRCYTIELSPELHAGAERRLSRFSHVTCVEGESSVELPRILRNINEPALFWLDAHATGGNTADAGFDPVLRELDAIYRHRVKNHVILIDDASGREETVARRLPSHYRAAVRNDIIRIVPA